MSEHIKLPEGFSVEERGKRAEQYFLEGYNCAQSVALAFSDLLPDLPEDTLKKLSAGFGGGFGRLREVCGAVSGMTMFAGFIVPASDSSDKAAKTANYALVQEMAEEFRKVKGSIVCRDLLNMSMEAKAGMGTIHSATATGVLNEGPQPSPRTDEYYRTRPCTANVGLAARILAARIQYPIRQDK